MSNVPGREPNFQEENRQLRADLAATRQKLADKEEWSKVFTSDHERLRQEHALVQQKLAEAQADCAAKDGAIREYIAAYHDFESACGAREQEQEAGTRGPALKWLRDSRTRLTKARAAVDAALASNAGNALVKELREFRNLKESLDARRPYVALCHHLPQLVIDSENGPLCCECWAIKEAARADEADREHADTLKRCGEKVAELDGLRNVVVLNNDLLPTGNEFTPLHFLLEEFFRQHRESVKELERLRAEMAKAHEETRWWHQCLTLVSHALTGNTEALTNLSEDSDWKRAFECVAFQQAKDLRAQRDQAVLLVEPARLLTVALARFFWTSDHGKDMREGTPDDIEDDQPKLATHWRSVIEALAKLAALNPPTSDDTLKV